jgi:hypothetical protein
MKGSSGSEKLIRALCEAWRPIDEVRNGCGDDSPGYERLLYRRGGGKQPVRESDRPTVVMLECDVNLCCFPAQQSRNGG